MDHDFWLRRWREGRTGFHASEVQPLLERYWGSLGLAPGSRVFVPLAGKTLDLLWLAARGHRVFGIELSPLAVAQFFAEHNLAPELHESHLGMHHRAGAIELVCGDVFALGAADLVDCAGVYDRAALIALPAPLRRRYVEDLHGCLPRGCRGLLIALEYPPHEKDGPPFPLTAGDVRALYEPEWRVDPLERRDILAEQPAFAAEGVTSLHTSAYRLEHVSPRQMSPEPA
jgi:thiopurine S-methyltransferase